MTFFDCPFCPLSDRQSSLNTRLLIPGADNEAILENDHFVVVADAAPIRAGHALIVLKKHEMSVFESGAANWPAMAELCAEIESRIAARLGLPVVIWEHGSLSPDASPGCIEHAHVHVLPAAEPVRHAIAKLVGTAFERLENPARFVARCRHQYLLLRDINGTWYGQMGKTFESQLFRRALAHTGDLKLDRWQKGFTVGHIDTCRSLFLESRDLLL